MDQRKTNALLFIAVIALAIMILLLIISLAGKGNALTANSGVKGTSQGLTDHLKGTSSSTNNAETPSTNAPPVTPPIANQAQQPLLVKPIDAKLDQFGNPVGSEYDLCKDGAHKGKTIVVLQLLDFSFNEATKALETKGFKVVHHKTPPPPENLRLQLKEACQIWVISNSSLTLNEQHIQVIKEFFESGKGVYIWGDNRPYYVDANALGKALLGVEMRGNTPGEKVVKKALDVGKPGFIAHPITTGLNSIYEGNTVATIGEAQNIQPIMRGSANNVVTAVYDRNGKRAVIDGGFTRLYPKFWNKTAGTARFVKNAACWLVNGK